MSARMVSVARFGPRGKACHVAHIGPVGPN